AALAAPPSARAAPGPDALPAERAGALSDRCESAAIRAAAASGAPLDLLRAIALAETGTALGGEARPWPWTVNMEGEGRWFASPADLLDWVERRRRAGARSFDLGCFQVNHLWHGEAFASLQEMIDPETNALYAARFLRELREETGSWEAAAGLYHSRTPELASRYRGRVLAILAELQAPGARRPELRPNAPVFAGGVEARPEPGTAREDRRIAVHGRGGVTLLLLGLAAADAALVPMNESGPRGRGLLRRAGPLLRPVVR
ncbi:MAG: hypothetical protein AAF676_14120, partial [Pseudomonadota bacterium]